MGRTGFNKVALEDAFIQGPPQLILFNVYSQTSLPSGLDNWQTVFHNLDYLHWGFSVLKQSIHPFGLNTTQILTLATTPTLDTPVPMDINQSRSRPGMCTCYNCSDKGHLSHMSVQNLRSKEFS